MFDPEEIRKKQMQLDYCIYMMATSYFKKATLRNTSLDKILYLQYQDMKTSKQVELEEKVIYILENHIIPRFNARGIDNENLDIMVKMVRHGNSTDMHLYTDNFECVLSGSYTDEFCTKIKIDCEFAEEEKIEKNKKEKANIQNMAKWIDV